MYNNYDLERIDLKAAPPETEPERQYYFIAKVRELLLAREAQEGRKLTACIKTFGCPKNDV